MTWTLWPCTTFAEHAAAWDALQRATTRTPFLESLFLQPLIEEFGSGREVLAMHRSDGDIDAATIVRPVGLGMWETFQPSQLPLGPWMAKTGSALAKQMRSLLAALPRFGLGLGVTQLDPRLQPRPTERGDLRLLDYVNTSHIDICGTFEEYWEARGKNLRQNTRKQRNKLQAEGIEPRLDCITDPTQVAAAMDDYGRLESAGWKAGTGTAIHPDNAQGRFYRRMLESFCTAGRARIYRYHFGKKVVSMDLCIDDGPLVVVLKTAYDESYRAVSPSTLMRQDEFKRWWDEGRYRRIEFYGKTMEWHTRWTEAERGLYHATVYRWPALRTLHERLLRLQAARAPSKAPRPTREAIK
jgi:CelD/BcsL family acetyltransferase involved in cellulose biosynthesis